MVSVLVTLNLWKYVQDGTFVVYVISFLLGKRASVSCLAPSGPTDFMRLLSFSSVLHSSEIQYFMEKHKVDVGEYSLPAHFNAELKEIPLPLPYIDFAKYQIAMYYPLSFTLSCGHIKSHADSDTHRLYDSLCHFITDFLSFYPVG